MKKILKITAVALGLALAFGLIGCSKKTSSKEAQTIKFGILPGTIRTAVVLLANHLGYYEEEGVNVEFKEVANAPAALTSISLAKGELDIWGTGIVPDLNFIANGSDLVIFEGTAAEGGAIVAKPENVEKYKTINSENYNAIRIATVRADTAWVVSRAYLEKQGIDVNSIDVMEVDTQINVAEAVNKGEAVLGFLPVEFARKYSDKVDVVYEVGELEPLYVCCRQVTARTTLEQKHDELVRFTKANLRALKYYNDPANRDAIVSYLAEYSSQTKEYVYNYLFENRTIMTLNPNRNGVIEYYNSLVNAGYFKGDIKIEDHIDTAIYEEALSQIKKQYPKEDFYKTL
jgi:NitT/TauT family transport system substrate-binding protein